MTIVNGEVLVEKDKHTGALPGAVLGCGNALLHRRSGGGPARGDHALPLTDDELLSKYRDCVRCSFVHRSILRSANLDGVKGFAFAPTGAPAAAAQLIGACSVAQKMMRATATQTRAQPPLRNPIPFPFHIRTRPTQ